MSGVVVRRLGCADLAGLRAVNSLFAEVFEDPESYEAAPPDAAYLTQLLGREEFVALVAEAEGKVLGGLVAYELKKFEKARSEFYIYDIGVDEAARRQGIASRLIAHLCEIACNAGSAVVFVQADLDDPPAQALYAKLGEGRSVLHFEIDVPTARDP